MKRLLCLGFPDMYQVTKAFRNGESGRIHNPEFTMLEWYRRGFSLEALMAEVEALCLRIAPGRAVERMTWRQAFDAALGLDPLGCPWRSWRPCPAVREPSHPRRSHAFSPPGPMPGISSWPMSWNPPLPGTGWFS